MVDAQSLIHQSRIRIRTTGRETREITDRIAAVVADSGIGTGLVHVFIMHTSASLMIGENADPDVCTDLETFFNRLVPDGDALFRHRAEGPDDMSGHVRSVLTHTDLDLPVENGRLALGTWQGVFLWEHRYRGRERCLIATARGSP